MKYGHEFQVIRSSTGRKARMLNRWRRASISLLTFLALQNPANGTALREIMGAQPGGSQEKSTGPELSASQLFRKVAPAVFVIEALDGRGVVIKAGSGVAVAPDQVVTNNHVVEGAVQIRARQEDRTWPAEVTHVDADHDLCRLVVKGLKAETSKVRVSSTLNVGERVYAIGAPEGLELTLSEGLISGLRPFDGGVLVQTTAAISGGSSGGGLFDTKGRLIGIITFTIKGAQQLNFALPGDWILSLDQHAVSSRPAPDLRNSPGFRSMELWAGGYAAQQAGDLERAAESYLQATYVNPSNVQAWLALGAVYKRLKRPDSLWEKAFRIAIQLEQDFIRQDATNYFAWLNLGQAYSALGQYEDAAKAYRTAMPLVPADSPELAALGWAVLAETLVSAGHLDQAIEVLEEGIRLYPRNAGLRGDLGIAFSQRNVLRSNSEDLDRAISQYREALRLKPEDAFVYYRLGLALSVKGDVNGAVAAYQEALRLNPGLTEAREGLDRVRKRQSSKIVP